MKLGKTLVKLGAIFLILSYVLVLILFAHAFFNPIHTVCVRINSFGEMWAETIAIVLSILAVPVFLWTAVRRNVIIPFWMRDNYYTLEEELMDAFERRKIKVDSLSVENDATKYTINVKRKIK